MFNSIKKLFEKKNDVKTNDNDVRNEIAKLREKLTKNIPVDHTTKPEWPEWIRK